MPWLLINLEILPHKQAAASQGYQHPGYQTWLQELKLEQRYPVCKKNTSNAYDQKRRDKKIRNYRNIKERSDIIIKIIIP